MLVLVSMGVPAHMRVLVGMRMRVLTLVGMAMLVFMPMFAMRMIVPAAVVIRVLLVRGAAMNVELHPLDLLPLRAIVVHVKVPEIQLAEFPLQGARLHAEVDQGADHHVATDSGNAVQ